MHKNTCRKSRKTATANVKPSTFVKTKSNYKSSLKTYKL